MPVSFRLSCLEGLARPGDHRRPRFFLPSFVESREAWLCLIFPGRAFVSKFLPYSCARVFPRVYLRIYLHLPPERRLTWGAHMASPPTA
ncbi:hypothetical protein E2C01_054708 [Portunus trituberculatus]|uniref:Uncharacterized protein n=1 Tax=Portunus trituberculatus TaxID=210409 RepID=A0A5B7GVR2_PORTR|nr:hypothetical protein [Portunus trituberculatus]